MKYIFVLLAAMAVFGCSTTGTSESLAINYLISKSTIEIIDRTSVNPSDVVKAVQDARRHIETGKTVSIGNLYEAALERITGLDPADRMLIQAILGDARDRLQDRIGSGDLDPNERVSLMETLDWIEAAAR